VPVDVDAADPEGTWASPGVLLGSAGASEEPVHAATMTRRAPAVTDLMT